MTIKTVQREATLECQTPRAMMTAMTVDGDDDEDGSGEGSKGEMTMDDEDSGKVSNGEGGMISGSLS